MDDDRLAYRYEADRDDWTRWKRQVPREQSLRERLDDLRRLDRDFDVRALVAAETNTDDLDADALGALLEDPPPEADRTRVALLQIRRRCMSALPAARSEGCDAAADKLSEIQSICDDLLDF
jgi:hypothetical protein